MPWWTSQALVASVALVFAVITYSIGRLSDRRIRRADLIRSFTSDFYSNEDLVRAFERIDSGSPEVWPASLDDLLGTVEEQQLIHLLDYLNTVGLALDRRVLPASDLAGITVGYVAFTVWHDERTQSFLEHVRFHDGETGYMGSGFQHFYRLARHLDRWSWARGGDRWQHQDVLRSGWSSRGRRFRGSRAARRTTRA